MGGEADAGVPAQERGRRDLRHARLGGVHEGCRWYGAAHDVKGYRIVPACRRRMPRAADEPLRARRGDGELCCKLAGIGSGNETTSTTTAETGYDKHGSFALARDFA